jgi:hypothetical protein
MYGNKSYPYTSNVIRILTQQVKLYEKVKTQLRDEYHPPIADVVIPMHQNDWAEQSVKIKLNKIYLLYHM